MAHLTHKLPWASLAVAIPAPGLHGRKPEGGEAFGKKVEHLAAALGAAVEEFAATDKRTVEEKAQYDVEKWESHFCGSIALFGAGGCRGFVESVINGYVVLNLLVESEARVRAALFDPQHSSTLLVNGGHQDGSHPEWLANKLQPLVEGYRCVPKPLDAEVVQGIREYCAELFKCMYARPDLFTRERISQSLWVLHQLCHYEVEY